MLKILLVSDNHGDYESISRILSDNPSCDYYFHCGDACLPPEEMKPFLVVKGNNDWGNDYPKQKIIKIKGHKILLFHGNGYTFSKKDLRYKTIEEGCDTVFYGHTHLFNDEIMDGIHLINPGSCYYNRDYTAPCYAQVFIDDDDNIFVKRVNI
ncbi:MAG: metallophosphoesterase family protein [Erysipelotrichaceae bacterium]|nr:metallophosphoesterase family protein [Erysipelotrichaceae bacterium]